MNDADAQTHVVQQITAAIARVLEAGAVAALVTVVDAPHGVGRKILLEQSGARTCTTGDDALDAALGLHADAFLAARAEAQTLSVAAFAPQLEAWRTARVLFERIEPEPHVVVCGAGHVGAALARLAHSVGYRVTLIDDRADFVTRARFPAPEINLVAAQTGWAAAVQANVGTGRGHNEDEECMRAVLAARPDYAGMIGSKRRTNIVLARLSAAGVPDEVLNEVRAPVGLDIGAVTPEEVALAILAEIVAARRGGAGTPLSVWRRGNKKAVTSDK
jgi:xanthine dehydrogenase accessory factor